MLCASALIIGSSLETLFFRGRCFLHRGWMSSCLATGQGKEGVILQEGEAGREEGVENLLK